MLKRKVFFLGLLISSLLLNHANAFDSVYLKGSYSTNQLGAATYTIPLEIPPGIGSFRPNLNLSYSSLGQNGLFGMGWSLSTLSTITRCPIHRNGVVGTVDLTIGDGFCLDGVLLQFASGVPFGDAEYRTEIDNFQRVYFYKNGGNSYWVAFTRTGQKLTFGQSSDSRIKAQSNPTVVVWALDSVTDIDGNYYKILYQNDAVNGQYYPLEINYTGNIAAGVNPMNSVKFFYETRPDISPIYRADIKLYPFVRVTNIKTYVGTKQIYDYQFNYRQSGQTGRSLLKGLTVANRDGIKSLLPTNFEWNGSGATYADSVGLPNQVLGTGQVINAKYVGGIEPGNSGSGIYTNGDAQWVSGDFNGDGISDFIQPSLGASSMPTCFSTFGGIEFKCTNYELPQKLSGTGSFITGDFDGDGLTDFSQVDERSNYMTVCFSDGNGQFTCSPKSMPHLPPVEGVTINLQYNGSPLFHQQFFSGDFDGDGRADIFAFSLVGSSPKICFSRGRAADNNCFNTPLMNDFIPLNMVAGDFDGDGRLDIAYVPLNPYYTGTPGDTQSPTLSGGIQVCYSNGNSGFACEMKYTLPKVGTGECGASALCYGPFFAGDFNGDGVTDLAQFSTDNKINIYPSIGRRIQPTAMSMSFANIGTWKDAPFIAADLNGDGKSDVITKSGSQTEVCYSHGEGNFSCTAGPTISQSKILAGNFTGDATTSIVSGEMTGSSLMAFLNPMTYPDLLTSIQNGIGSFTNIFYQPLTNGSIYTKSSGSVYPLKDIQTSTWAVSIEKQDDGNGGQRERNFKYYGSKSDSTGRGLLGFSQVDSTDVTGKVFTRAKYNQPFPYTGQIAELTRFTYNSTLQKYMKATASTYTYDSDLSYDTGRYLVYMSGQQDISYDINSGTLLTNSHTDSQYDDYGNKISETTSTSDGYIVEKINSIRNFTGDPNSNQAAWYLGQVDQVLQKNTNPDGTTISRLTSYLYNLKRHATQEFQEPNNPATNIKTNFGYDIFGNLTSKSVSGSNLPVRTETTTYDSSGQFPIQRKNAYNHTQTFTYDIGFGLVASATDANSLVTKFTYDDFGRKINEIRPDGTQTKYFFMKCAPVICGLNQSYFVQVQKTGFSPQFVYFDSLNRDVVVQTGGLNGQWIYKYKRFDEIGNIQWISNSTNSIPSYYTRYTYDPLKRVLSQTNPDGNQNTFIYDGLSTITTNAKGHRRTETKNSIGQLVSVKDDSNKVLRYTYDPFGNLLTLTDSKGNETSFSYDILGHRTSKKDTDSGLWLFQYNAAGELISSTDAKGNVNTSSYDNLGRMINQVTAEGISNWIYDSSPNGVGKIASTSRDNGYSKIYSYDTLGRTSSVQTTLDTAYTISTIYDSVSRPSKITYPTGFAVTYKYDLNGFLIEMNNAATNASLWKLTSANADNKPLKEVFGNNVTTTKNYYPDTGQLHTVKGSSASGLDIQDLNLEYDSLGNLTRRTELINQGTGATLTESFDYDNLNRLISVTGPNTKFFSYDEIGNILSKSDVGTYTYGTGAVGSPTHGVMAIAGNSNLTFTYDANGNILTGNGRTTSWTSFNKPLRIANSQNTIDFLYDSNLERFKETSTACRDYQGNTSSNCIKYVIDPAPGTGMHFEKEVNGSITTFRNYLYAGPGNMIGVYTTTSNGTQSTQYFHKDHLGSLSLVTDEGGAVAERLSYDAFGKRRYVDGSDDPGNSLKSIVSHQGFTLQEHLDDGGMGLIHMNGRVYDPFIGRFMSVDPYISDALNMQTINRFSYVINNPLNLTDPSGFFLGIDGDVGEFLDNTFNGLANSIAYGVFNIGGINNILSSFNSIVDYIKSNPWAQDVFYAAATVALITVSGGTFAAALIAVGSVAGGAAAGAATLAAFQGGNFWDNFSGNFHTNFRIGLALLAVTTLYADMTVGGLAAGRDGAGGNGLNGWVRTKDDPTGALTLGSGTTYWGASADAMSNDGVATFAPHEFGHTIEFILINAGVGATGGNNNDVWNVYLGTSAIGAIFSYYNYPFMEAPIGHLGNWLYY